MIALAVFVVSGALIAYVYGGYGALLRLLLSVGGRSDGVGDSESAQDPTDEELPSVTVFVSAYNEADRIGTRIDDLLDQDYPFDKLEIVVVSDGSTDGTEDEVRRKIREHPDRDIRLIAFEENRGRAVAQNMMPSEARHDILLSTDADTVFETDFLRKIAAPFSDPDVAVAGGTLVYRELESDVSASIQDYWGYELALREAEQELGVLTKVSGPCVAYRKGIWRPIEEFEDVDRVAVFFARKQGLRAVHVWDAVCYDTPNQHWRQEIRVRRRMTRKGVLSIFNRWRWEDIRREPMFTFALYSHKVARYPTPVYSLALGASALYLLQRMMGIGPAIGVLGLAALALWTAAATGSASARWATGRLKSFLLANAGFAWGLLDVATGNREGRYRPTRKLAPEDERGRTRGQ